MNKLALARTAAAITLAAAAIAAPVAAQASTYPQPTPTPTPGVAVPITTPTGIFAGNEPVTVLLSGEDANFASAGQAIVRAVYVASANIGTVRSNAQGGVSLAVTLPSTATGTYSTLLTSPSRPQGYEVTISATGGVISGGASSGSGAAGSGSSAAGLPATGMDSGSLLGLWVGGGALVLAGGAVAVGAAVHRQRKHADA